MRTYKFLLTASIVASILSTISSWFFYSRWEEMEDTHFELQKKNNELSTTCDMLQMAHDSVLTELEVFHDPEFRVFSLYSKDAPKKERMRVFWNLYNRKTFVEALSLPPLQPGEHYELYSVVGNNRQLVATMSGETIYEQLSLAGNVAAADGWELHKAVFGDSTATVENSLLLSSH
jgi:hypothetical protein